MLEKSIAVLLPFSCILCGQVSDRRQDLCSGCLQDLPIIAQSCPRCANKMPSSLICGSCLHEPPPFSAAYTLFAYEPPVVSMILELKFRGRLCFARILGELLAEKIIQDWYRSKPLPDVLLPVPLHEKRLQERGFNQALELARPIAARVPIQLDWKMVHRLENTPPQRKLSADERRKNLKNAFVVNQPLQGKNIAVLDDVMTTGSTVTALTQALIDQGANRVEVWCCART